MGRYFVCSQCGAQEKGWPPGCGCAKQYDARIQKMMKGSTIMEIGPGDETYSSIWYLRCGQTGTYLIIGQKHGLSGHEEGRGLWSLMTWINEPRTPTLSCDSKVAIGSSEKPDGLVIQTDIPIFHNSYYTPLQPLRNSKWADVADNRIDPLDVESRPDETNQGEDWNLLTDVEKQNQLDAEMDNYWSQ